MLEFACGTPTIAIFDGATNPSPLNRIYGPYEQSSAKAPSPIAYGSSVPLITLALIHSSNSTNSGESKLTSYVSIL